jgi:hypothetical protein
VSPTPETGLALREIAASLAETLTSIEEQTNAAMATARAILSGEHQGSALVAIVLGQLCRAQQVAAQGALMAAVETRALREEMAGYFEPELEPAEEDFGPTSEGSPKPAPN